uniref:Uncharacterized protein n=1 Tax=Setaria viridis TaxID=4556 RepID=A0A4U6URE7_SETVI|nr:hypothetical protein SEVIR_5G469400v2 [Setaria viridis]
MHSANTRFTVVIENPIHDSMWSTRNQASGEARKVRKEVCQRMQEQGAFGSLCLFLAHVTSNV